MALIRDRYNRSHKNEDDTFTVHKPDKEINFLCSRRGIYYHDCIPGQQATTMVQNVKGNAKGFTNRQITAARRDCHAYVMVARPSLRYFERMVRANMIHNYPVTVTDIKNNHTILGTDIGSNRGKTARTNKEPVVSDCITIPKIIMEQKIKLDLTGNVLC